MSDNIEIALGVTAGVVAVQVIHINKFENCPGLFNIELAHRAISCDLSHIMKSYKLGLSCSTKVGVGLFWGSAKLCFFAPSNCT